MINYGGGGGGGASSGDSGFFQVEAVLLDPNGGIATTEPNQWIKIGIVREIDPYRGAVDQMAPALWQL